MKQLLVFAAILLFSNFHLRGQNQLEDILAQLPAKSSAQLELLMEQLAGQGAPAVLELAGNLVPPRILTEDVKGRSRSSASACRTTSRVCRSPSGCRVGGRGSPDRSATARKRIGPSG
jgi:hypothetical protein